MKGVGLETSEEFLKSFVNKAALSHASFDMAIDVLEVTVFGTLSALHTQCLWQCLIAAGCGV